MGRPLHRIPASELQLNIVLQDRLEVCGYPLTAVTFERSAQWNVRSEVASFKVHSKRHPRQEAWNLRRLEKVDSLYIARLADDVDRPLGYKVVDQQDVFGRVIDT